MKFLNKTSVAVTLTVLIVALCCVLGYTRSAPDEVAVEDDHVVHRAGESNLNYYLGWIDDGATLFSIDTIDILARLNLELDNQYDSLLAIKTVWHLSGMEIDAYAQNTADHLDLGSRDLLLLLDNNTQDWYVTYGGGIRSYVEADNSLAKLFAQHLGPEFFAEGSDRNQEILALFGNLNAWYEAHVPAAGGNHDPIFHFSEKSGMASVGGIVKGILFTLAANSWWIILLFLIFYVLDSIRFNRFYARRSQGNAPHYRPFLFWHAPGAQWYEKMFQQAQDAEYGYDEDDDFLGPDGPDAGAGGDGYRHGPGFSTDPNEPGPFAPQYSTDPNEPGPFGPHSAK